MNEKILKEVSALKNALEGDERSIRLSELESRLEKDETVLLYSKKAKDKEEAYSFSLSSFGKGKKETMDAQKELYEAKKELDSLPLVKEYNEAYVAVRDIYMQIDDIIFSPFRHKVLKID